MHRDQLKKFQSLDCQGRTAATAAAMQQKNDESGPVGATAASQQRPLVHSVSIVVDLAKVEAHQQQQLDDHHHHQQQQQHQHHHHQQRQHHQQQQQSSCGALSSCGSSGNSNDETTTSDTGGEEHEPRSGPEDGALGCAGNQRSEEEAEEAEEDEEEQEEELDRCLISGLARRVVLVDEADKKFLRNRARSAEPQMLRMHLAGLWGPQSERGGPLGSRCESVSPIELEQTRHRQASPSAATTTAATGPAAATTTAQPATPQYRHSSSPFDSISSSIHHDHHPLQQQQQQLELHRQEQQRQQLQQQQPLGPITRSNGNAGLAGLRPRLSLASASLSSAATTAAAKSRPTSSGGELAESGKLSMRRNTHHHVNFSPNDNNNNPRPYKMGQQSALNRQQQQQQPMQPTQSLVMRTSVGQASSTPAESATIAARAARSPSLGHGGQSSPLKHPQFHFSTSIGNTQSTSNNQNNTNTRIISPVPSSSSSSSHTRSPSLHHQHNWPAQHRRQSLQICLLTGSAGRSIDPGRTLTEEELRGEREFNEQVRNAARSPSDFGHQSLHLHHHHHHHYHNSNQQQQQQQQRPHQTILRRASLSRPSTPVELSAAASKQEARCQSTGGGAGLESDWRELDESERTSGSQQDQKRALLSSPRDSASLRSRRRVSFGCIDPIPVAATRYHHVETRAGFAGEPSDSVEQPAGQQPLNLKRASICCSAASFVPPTSSGSSIGSGILRKLEKVSLGASTSDSASKSHQSTSDTSSGQKIHTPDTQSRHWTAAGDAKKLDELASSNLISTSRELHDGTFKSGLRDSLSKFESRLLERDTNKWRDSGLERGDKDKVKEEDRDQTRKMDNYQRESDAETFMSSGKGEPQARPGRRANDGGSQDPSEPSWRHDQDNDDEIATKTTPPPSPSTTTPTTTTTTTTPSGTHNSARGRHSDQQQQLTNSHAHQADDSRVESIMANAKLRQEEFARLLEEHEQIVIEINRFETKISNAAATAAAAATATATTTTTQTNQ